MSHKQFMTESPVAECKRESQKTFVGLNVGQGRKKVRFKDIDEIIPEGQDSSQDQEELEESQKRSQKRSQESMGGID